MFFSTLGKVCFAQLPSSVTLPASLPGSLFPWPYEAIYQLDLESTAPESLTEDANGVLSVKFQDVGNGWTLQQQGSLKIRMADFSEGEEEETEQSNIQKIEWTYIAWEAKNGRHFRFLLRRWLDGILEEDTQGEMDYDPQLRQGTITYQAPIALAQPFYGDVLFPTAYMGKILQKICEEGGGLVSSLVFNGLSAEGLLRLNTFVGEPRKVTIPFQGVHKSASNDLMPKTFIAYPTFTASYPPQGQEEQPESEASQEITARGFPLTSILDFGDFKLKAQLKLTPPAQKKAHTSSQTISPEKK